MGKPSWDSYYLGIAEAASKRSSCDRSKVGAAVVKDNRVRSLGYNDSPAGTPGCESCPRRSSEACAGVSSYDDGGTRCVAVHAEANALLHADREDLVGATLYITRAPCAGCTKLIEAAGIKKVIWPELLEAYNTPQRHLFGTTTKGEYFETFNLDRWTHLWFGDCSDDSSCDCTG